MSQALCSVIHNNPRELFLDPFRSSRFGLGTILISRTQPSSLSSGCRIEPQRGRRGLPSPSFASQISMSTGPHLRFSRLSQGQRGRKSAGNEESQSKSGWLSNKDCGAHLGNERGQGAKGKGEWRSVVLARLHLHRAAWLMKTRRDGIEHNKINAYREALY